METKPAAPHLLIFVRIFVGLNFRDLTNKATSIESMQAAVLLPSRI